MKMRGLGAVLLLLGSCGLQQIHADTAIGILPELPDHPGQCYENASGPFYDIGSRWYKEGFCYEMICGSDHERGTMIISYFGCGSVGAEPPCTVSPQDLSKPYPECCSTIVCPNQN